MLESLFGNIHKEKILLFLYTQQGGYAREIARIFGVPLRSIQLQLKNLEGCGAIVGIKQGRTLVYQFNPRYFYLPELKSLLKKMYEAVSQKDKDQYYRLRRRPRRAGKP